jgi:hypothetical protein
MVTQRPLDSKRAIIAGDYFQQLIFSWCIFANVHNGLLTIMIFIGDNSRQLESLCFSASGCKTGMQKQIRSGACDFFLRFEPGILASPVHPFLVKFLALLVFTFRIQGL